MRELGDGPLVWKSSKHERMEAPPSSGSGTNLVLLLDRNHHLAKGSLLTRGMVASINAAYVGQCRLSDDCGIRVEQFQTPGDSGLVLDV